MIGFYKQTASIRHWFKTDPEFRVNHKMWLKLKPPEGWRRIRRTKLSKHYIIQNGEYVGFECDDPAVAVNTPTRVWEEIHSRLVIITEKV